jgi:hypothetical protein
LSVEQRGPLWLARFLELLERGYPVTVAAELGGFHRRRAYDLRDRDEAFASARDAAIDAPREALDAEADRRIREELSASGAPLLSESGHVRRVDRLLRVRGSREGVTDEGYPADRT